MARRPVLRYPDPALKQVARVPRADEVARVAEDLVDTMRAHPGCVGLAAPQIGELVRIVVVDVRGHPRAESDNGLLVIVEPAVVAAAGAEVAREGCLSIPDLTANVRRATEITVTGGDPDGAPVRVESHGFEARCLQHEIDHLDGILFLDRVDSLKRDVFRRKRYAGPRDGLKLDLRRVFPAPPSAVFRACTEPELLAQWWGPHGFTAPSIELDVRVGGRYRITMQPPEGDAFHLSGEFREVDAPRRLAYTFVWEEPDPDDQETVVTISLAQLGEATEFVLSQGPFATEARLALHRGGWSDGFERLAAALADNART